MYLAIRKCKNDCKLLKIIPVPNFCLLKPEIARFSIGFRLNLLLLAFLFKDRNVPVIAITSSHTAAEPAVRSAVKILVS